MLRLALLSAGCAVGYLYKWYVSETPTPSESEPSRITTTTTTTSSSSPNQSKFRASSATHSNPSPSSPATPFNVPASTSTSKPSPSFTAPNPSSRPAYKVPPSTSTSKPPPSFATPSPSSRLPCDVPASTSTSKPSQSSTDRATSSFSKPTPLFKPTLSPPSNTNDQETCTTNHELLEKGKSLLIYAIPRDVEDLIRRNRVPRVLKNPLSPSTYRDYFTYLLYAEHFYIENWSEFKLLNVTLNLQKALNCKKTGKSSYFTESYERDDKNFLAFEIDTAREKRPFLLSRDLVIARPCDKYQPFKGIIHRVSKKQVIVEFGDDFHLQHHSSHKYDISFSFDRVCLKRAREAVDAASDPLFASFIFPECASRKSIPASPSPHFCNHNLDVSQKSAICQILCFQGPPPYLVEGPLCVNNITKSLSRTGLVVQEAVLQIYKRSAKNRILICAPINSTCDVLMRSLKKEIPDSDMFRANAAFREVDGVPVDILPSCSYKGDCFTCPSLKELKKFRVILSTFACSFRLHNEGINAGHFSHVFMVDASSATEPEAMVALANLATVKTDVIVTGAPNNRSGWIRSDIARKNGLMISYFERLRKSEPYASLNPVFITRLVDSVHESNDDHSFV